MTLPIERTRAVIELARAVNALIPYSLGSSENVRVPRHLLRNLQDRMRHYPTATEIDMTAKRCPELWGTTGEL